MLQPPGEDDKQELQEAEGATISSKRWSCCTAKAIVTFLLAAGLLGGGAVYVLKYQEDIVKATILHEEAIKREEFLLKNATPAQVLQVLQQWSDAEILEAVDVRPRAWQKWQYNESSPHLPAFCTPAPSNWKKSGVQKRVTRTGLMFVKIPKCASSTGATVALRMATTISRDFGLNFSVCENRLRHASVLKMQYGKRDPFQSFLWSQVRDPTRRAISEYFHFFVSRKGINASDDQRFKSVVGGFGSLMVRFMGTSRTKNQASKINMIFKKYNFVGLAERLDESTVAMQLLLGLKPSNILYMSSKMAGGYDAMCKYIQPAVLSPGMQEYFASSTWNKRTFWDQVLVKAVNASLDLTIDALGRKEFEKHLKEFLTLKSQVQSACKDIVRMPCKANGSKQRPNDCLIKDNGCGFRCMDAEVEKQLPGNDETEPDDDMTVGDGDYNMTDDDNVDVEFSNMTNGEEDETLGADDVNAPGGGEEETPPDADDTDNDNDRTDEEDEELDNTAEGGTTENETSAVVDDGGEEETPPDADDTDNDNDRTDEEDEELDNTAEGGTTENETSAVVDDEP